MRDNYCYNFIVNEEFGFWIIRFTTEFRGNIQVLRFARAERLMVTLPLSNHDTLIALYSLKRIRNE